MLYVCVGDVMDVVFSVGVGDVMYVVFSVGVGDVMYVSVFCLYSEAWSYTCSCMGSVSISSCRCCMFVSCVHSVAFLNATFCMTCSKLVLSKMNFIAVIH